MVEDHAQRVDIGGGTDLAMSPGGLLGGHVVRRTERLAGEGEIERFPEAFGQSEVGQMGLIVGVDEHVGRLEVAMKNAVGMGVVDGLGQDFDAAGGAGGREGAIVDDVGQIRP